jgi:hypothetical protein
MLIIIGRKDPCNPYENKEHSKENDEFGGRKNRSFLHIMSISDSLA